MSSRPTTTSTPADPEWPMLSAMHYDLVRSLNKDVPGW